MNALPFLALLALGCSSLPANAQPVPALPTPLQQEGELEWYLPTDVAYDPDFPRPESVLGWPVGRWHVRHDQLVAWFRKVAEVSPRFRLQTYGHSHEQRPLLLAAVSAPENLARLDQIQGEHRASVLAGEPYDGPAIVWLGYSVHGNEPSGANAALLVAYHLAAAQGTEIERFLRDTVVLIDPSINPDGLSRFAQWANSHRSTTLVSDSASREHNEVWPGGRTNHYWFDLNRDWLLLTHPESRGRLEQFHAWLPMVLTDHHEMGTDSTFFFQPGIPSRQNPLTPEENLDLTRAIAERHAHALDRIGSFYYTEESFDDFYYGKGSTYPDLQGGVGILFEQASSRGHLQENSHGGISFPFTIRNQFTASLSTLQAVDEMRVQLADYQSRFFANARNEANEYPARAYVVSGGGDRTRLRAFGELLRRHQIEVHALGEDFHGQGRFDFLVGDSLLIPVDQPQFRLIQALFERRTSWPDNTFYDVSSWNLPLAFGLDFQAIPTAQWRAAQLGPRWQPQQAFAEVEEIDGAVAWAFDWLDEAAPRALQSLLTAGVRARVATRPFVGITAEGEHSFAEGSVLVPRSTQEIDPTELLALIQGVADAGIPVYALRTGLTPSGVDLGSGSLRPLAKPRPLMLVGGGVSAYEAGEVWHHLDLDLGVMLSKVEAERLPRLDLDRYTHLILVSGASSALGDEGTDRIKAWLRRGGVVVATRSSAVWAAKNLLPTPESAAASGAAETNDPGAASVPSRYADYRDLRAVHRIAGSIFATSLDLSHPLCFGYQRADLPVFRNSTSLLPAGDDPFAIPVRYQSDPLLSGYASDHNVARLAGTPAVRAERVGAGTVICLIDNPLFRGGWHGTRRLFDNALFFGPVIQATGPLNPPTADESVDADESH